MSKRFIITLVAIFVLVVAWFARRLARDYRQFMWEDEATRMEAADQLLHTKLAAYLSAHGRYPDSVDSLSFTNSASEIQILPDVQKIKYQCNENGRSCGLSYRGFWGYEIGEVCLGYPMRPYSPETYEAWDKEEAEIYAIIPAGSSFSKAIAAFGSDYTAVTNGNFYWADFRCVLPGHTNVSDIILRVMDDKIEWVPMGGRLKFPPHKSNETNH